MRILILDDDPDIRNLLETALVMKGHEVTTLSDPSEFHSMIDLRSARTATQPVTPLPLSSVLA